MKQLTFIKKGVLEWWDVEPPNLEQPTDIIARPLAVARCDVDSQFLFSDLHALLDYGKQGGFVDSSITHFMSDVPFKGPFPIGHECVAEIVDCGDEVKKFRVGDQVIIPFQISCGNCRHCHQEYTASCETVPPMSVYGFGDIGGPWGGAISDLVRVPWADHMLVRVPSGLSPLALASASDNLPVGWQSVAPNLLGRNGQRTLIVGGGAKSIALYAMGFAIALNSEVDYIDIGKDSQRIERLTIAEKIDATCLEPTRLSQFDKKYDLTVDASMAKSGLLLAINALDYEGTCVSPSLYFEKEVGIPLFRLFCKRNSLKMGYGNVRANIEDMMEVIRKKQFNPDVVNTTIAAWGEADLAFLENSTKVVVLRES